MAPNKKQNRKRNEGLIELLGHLEQGAEKVVRRFVEKAEESSRDLRENILDLAGKVRKEKMGDFSHLLDQILEKARAIEFGRFNSDTLIREAKKNLEGLVEKIQSSDLAHRALAKAVETKGQVFSALSIPTEEDVTRLSRKITVLEKRVNKLTRKAA